MVTDEEVTVTAPLELDAGGTWHYIHVSADVRSRWADRARRGAIRVTATIGSATWDGSLLPWADGSAQLSVNRGIRTREGLAVGDTVTVRLTPRD